MQLPFLKEKKWPRIAKPMEEKGYGFDTDEQIEEACIDELFEAAHQRDAAGFRRAIEALVMNCFEDGEGEPNAA